MKHFLTLLSAGLFVLASTNANAQTTTRTGRLSLINGGTVTLEAPGAVGSRTINIPPNASTGANILFNATSTPQTITAGGLTMGAGVPLALSGFPAGTLLFSGPDGIVANDPGLAWDDVNDVFSVPTLSSNSLRLRNGSNYVTINPPDPLSGPLTFTLPSTGGELLTSDPSSTPTFGDITLGHPTTPVQGGIIMHDNDGSSSNAQTIRSANSLTGGGATITIPNTDGADATFILSTADGAQTIATDVIFDIGNALTATVNNEEIVIANTDIPSTTVINATGLTTDGSVEAGSLVVGKENVFPTHGKIHLHDNTDNGTAGTGGAFRGTIQTVNTLTQNRTYTFPDADGTLLISGGVGSFSTLEATATTNQIALGDVNGAGNGVTINSVAPVSGDLTYTIPDVGANASFVMTEGAQTINGVKSFTGNITLDQANDLTIASTGISHNTASPTTLTFQNTDAGVGNVMNVIMENNLTAPNVYGSSANNGELNITATSGTGSGTGDAITMNVGNNGGTNAITIDHDGQVTIPNVNITGGTITGATMALNDLILGEATTPVPGTLTLHDFEGSSSYTQSIRSAPSVTAASTIITIPNTDGANAYFILSDADGAQQISTDLILDGGPLTIGKEAVSPTQGKIQLHDNTDNGAAGSGGAFIGTIQTVNTLTQNRTYTFPDADGTLLVSGGVGSFNTLEATATTNQIALGDVNGAGNGVTINSVAPASGDLTYTIPDVGANASFVMTEGSQTVNGAKSFTGNITLDQANDLTMASTGLSHNTASPTTFTFQNTDAGVGNVMNVVMENNLTVPTVYGSSANNGTLVINATSGTGSGTGNAITLNVGNNGGTNAVTIDHNGQVTIPNANITGGTITGVTLTGYMPTTGSTNYSGTMNATGSIAPSGGGTVTANRLDNGTITVGDGLDINYSGGIADLDADVNGTSIIFNGSAEIALNLANANTWTAAQAFPASNGISMGFTTFTSAASASTKTITFPDLSGTVVVSGQASLTLGNGTTSPLQGSVVLHDNSNSNSNALTLQSVATLTSNRTITFPDATGTVFVSGQADITLGNGTTVPLQGSAIFHDNSNTNSNAVTLTTPSTLTANRTIAFPDAAGTLVVSGQASITLGNGTTAPLQGSVVLHDNSNANSNAITLQTATTLTSNRTVTFPDASGTVALTGTGSVVNFSDGISVGSGGAAIYKVLRNSKTWAFDCDDDHDCEETTLTVTGAAVGDAVFVSAAENLLEDLHIDGQVNDRRGTFTAWVSDANTVTIRYCSGDNADIEAASGTIEAVVMDFTP